MTGTRERVLTVILGGFIVLAVSGFVLYSFVLSPLTKKQNQIVTLREEIATAEKKVADIRSGKPQLEKWKFASLPADRDFARTAYEQKLSELFRESGFEAARISINAKAIDEKAVPQYATKKPIYAKQVYTATVRGELASLSAFLEKFYKLPLLHQVRNLAITRPSTGGDSGKVKAGDLDINLTVEALFLDGADTRKTLLPPKPPELPQLLVGGKRDYAMLAGKNLFFAPSQAPREVTKPAAFDVMPFVQLDSIVFDDKGQPTVTLYDRYSNHDYLIKPRADGGGFRVEVSYTLAGKKRPLRSSKYIELQDDAGEVLKRWAPILIEDREMIVRDDSKYYSIRLGFTLADMVPLSKEELLELGIDSGKEEKKEPEKKEEKKEP